MGYPLHGQGGRGPGGVIRWFINMYERKWSLYLSATYKTIEPTNHHTPKNKKPQKQALYPLTTKPLHIIYIGSGMSRSLIGVKTQWINYRKT